MIALDDALIYWLAFGALLMLIEIALPGGFSFALGLAAIIAAGLAWAGFLETWLAFLATWVFLSAIMLAIFIPVAQRYFGGEVKQAVLDDDLHALDTEVEVIKDVSPDHSEGKIRYQGSLWAARSKVGTVRAGGRVKLVHRDGFVWIVEPVESAPAGGTT